MTAMLGRDIYVKYIGKNGKSHIAEHRVWDTDKFIAARHLDALKDGGRVELVSREDYQASK